MRSPCCLYACIPPIVARQRLGKNPPIVARQRLGKNPLIVARQRLVKDVPVATNIQARTEILNEFFSMRSVSYQMKEGD
jgi:hypothetical protein